MAETIFDAVVVGGGPAGYTFAIRAAQYGLKVALVDANDRLGGTCLLWGCIPTKAMLFTAEVWDHLKHADKYGIDVAAPALNWKNVLARKDDVISRHTKGLDFLMKKNKITTFKGYGKLTGPAKDGVFTVDVALTAGGQETVKAKKVVLATGSDDVRDAIARAEALTAARESADFAAISAAFKRISNILRQAKEKGFAIQASDERVLSAEAQQLSDAAAVLAPEVEKLRHQRAYGDALAWIATLRPVVDQFFDKVMVLDPDAEVRGANLALIDEVLRSFSGIADFSEIVTP